MAKHTSHRDAIRLGPYNSDGERDLERRRSIHRHQCEGGRGLDVGRARHVMRAIFGAFLVYIGHTYTQWR